MAVLKNMTILLNKHYLLLEVYLEVK